MDNLDNPLNQRKQREIFFHNFQNALMLEQGREFLSQYKDGKGKLRINVNIRDDDGFTPLLHAVINSRDGRNLGVVDELLDQGADVNSRDCKQRSILQHCVISEQHEDFVERLLMNGAEISSHDSAGRTALMAAIQLAASKNLYRNLDRLLERNVEINARDTSGKTALIRAASIVKDHNLAIIEKLALKNADAKLTDDEGKTAMDHIRLNENLRPESVQRVEEILTRNTHWTDINYKGDDYADDHHAITASRISGNIPAGCTN